MTVGEAATILIPSLTVSVVGTVLAFKLATKNAADVKRGERIGALEKWRDFEEGRRAGIEEERRRRGAREE